MQHNTVNSTSNKAKYRITEDLIIGSQLYCDREKNRSKFFCGFTCSEPPPPYKTVFSSVASVCMYVMYRAILYMEMCHGSV
jgi:hypothetical protein